MITGELKSKVDRVWDAFWSGGISNPLEVIEQITYLLFIRRLDDLNTLAEKKATGHREERGHHLRPRSAGPALVAVQERRARGDVQDRRRQGVSVPAHARRRRVDLLRAHEGCPLHHPHPAAAVAGGRHARRHPDGRPRHQRRPVRVPAVQDRQRRRQRPVPHPPAHHQTDGRDGRAPARPTRSATRLRHRGFLVAAGEYVREQHPQRARPTPRSASTSTPACSTATTSTPPCCASAA